MPTYKENALAEDVAALPRPKCYQTVSTADYMNGCQQMLADLQRLATEDGCVAAAWAHSVIEGAAPLAQLAAAIRGTINEQGDFYDRNTHALDELRRIADECYTPRH